MTDDVQRDIGTLEARIDGLEVRLDRQDAQVAEGFKGVHEKLDKLFAVEHERKGAEQGAKATWGKIIGAGTAIAGIAEALKAWWHK